MSIAIQNPDYFISSYLMTPSSISEDADQDLFWKVIIKKSVRRLWDKTSITFGEPLYDVVTSLFEIYKECSVPNWDGYGAHSISEDTYGEAFKIIDSLPSFIKMPEITCEPTGEIAFEWNIDREQMFVVSVGGKHKINYAGIFAGNNTIHGSEDFEESLPSTVINNLRRLYSY